MGMEYEKINAGPNDCIIYRKEFAALVQGREMTAVIFSFWLRVRNRCIYDRGKKPVVYASVTTRGI